MKCWWCGGELGRPEQVKEHHVNGVPQKFHVEQMMDCRNLYLKSIAKPFQKLERATDTISRPLGW